MHRGERRLRQNTALTCLLILLLVVVAESFGKLANLERAFYDARANRGQTFTPPPTDRVVHMDIDDTALESVGGWPWPRTRMAQVIDELRGAGAKVIGLDVLYSERQDERHERRPDGTYAAVQDDARLAAAIAAAGNVLVPTSLNINTSAQRKTHDHARKMLGNDLELSLPEVDAALRVAGFSESKIEAEVSGEFFAIRREAALDRVIREFDAAEAAGKPLPGPRELAAALLKRTDVNSPAGRMFFENAAGGGVKPGPVYEQAAAIRALRPLLPAAEPGRTPPLYQPDIALVPVADFGRAAKTTAFVDYPVFRDGVVRSVPLFVEFDGRLYPQMGLMMAAMMRDVDVRDLRLTAGAVTLPRGRTDGGDLVIPVRTHAPEGGGRPIPMTFDIPWVGTRDWKVAFPKQPHVSINEAYLPIKIRERIIDSNAGLDRALVTAVSLFDRPKAEAYLNAPLPLDDPLARMPRIEEALATVGPFIPEDAKPDPTKPADDPENFVISAMAAIRAAKAEHPQLKKQLDSQLASLKARVNGNCVLIGWAATAQTADRKPTSIHPEAPGVVVHGMIVNALLTGEVWRTLPESATLAVTVFVGLLATLAAVNLSPTRAMAACVALALAYVLLNWFVLFDWGNVLLGAAAPVVAVATVWSGGTLARLIMESVERARITRRFGAYVDPALVDYVLEHGEQAQFTGVEREMTVVFTDLVGFTSLSERLGRQIITVLNDFMDRASREIRKHHGYVNKFLGDGVMFFYNAPRERAEHAADAIETVLDINAMLREFNVDLVARDLPPLGMRAGVATGEMVVGDAGSTERCDYTVLGDNVNLAARLESANKAVGTSNLVTERTLEMAGDRYLCRPIGRLQVVGRTVGVMVYEVLARKAEATDEQRRLAEMTKAIIDCCADCRPADCLEAVHAFEEAFGESKFTHLYRDKCEVFLRNPDARPFEEQIVLTSK